MKYLLFIILFQVSFWSFGQNDTLEIIKVPGLAEKLIIMEGGRNPMNIKQFNSFLKKNNPKLQKKLRLYRTISVAASIGLGISSYYASLNFTIAYFYNTPVDKNTLLNTGIGLGASTGLYYANRKLLLTKIIREYNETIATKE